MFLFEFEDKYVVLLNTQKYKRLTKDIAEKANLDYIYNFDRNFNDSPKYNFSYLIKEENYPICEKKTDKSAFEKVTPGLIEVIAN